MYVMSLEICSWCFESNSVGYWRSQPERLVNVCARKRWHGGVAVGYCGVVGFPNQSSMYRLQNLRFLRKIGSWDYAPPLSKSIKFPTDPSQCCVSCITAAALSFFSSSFKLAIQRPFFIGNTPLWIVLAKSSLNELSSPTNAPSPEAETMWVPCSIVPLTTNPLWSWSPPLTPVRPIAR